MAEPTVATQPFVDWWQSTVTRHDDAYCVCLQGGWCSTIESLGKRVNVSHSTIFRRIREGRITITEADLWATRAGVHPTRVWTDFDRIKACGGRCNGHPNAIDDDRRQAIVAALGTGASQAAVAREHGVSPRTVSEIARKVPR
jgi:hypothetical protein